MHHTSNRGVVIRATVLHAPHDIRVEDVAEPTILAPGDAVVRVTAACICGSDLWPYRGIDPVPKPRRIGHEFIGVVEEVGAEVHRLQIGDFVIAPFLISDGTCDRCLRGLYSSCVHMSGWGRPDHLGLRSDGGQGERVRVPLADGTLDLVPGTPDESMLPNLLSLSDVMPTGYHAAVSAGVVPGSTVVVIGDGAVGLCGVIAAALLGAEAIVAMSRNPGRQRLAREFGATAVVPGRGAEGVAAAREALGGHGADCVLECVGTGEAMDQAIGVVRDGGQIGYVGAPHGSDLRLGDIFMRNLGLRGGVAPSRRYVPDLLPRVLCGEIDPGRVFDLTLPMEDVATGYRAMDERTAVKVLLRP